MSHQSTQSQTTNGFDFALVGLAIVGLDGVYRQANQVLCEMLGYSAEEMSHLSFRDTTHPDDLDEVCRQLEELSEGKTNAVQLQKRCLRRDSAIVWSRLKVSIASDGSGERHFVAQIEDITAREQAGESLQRSEEYFRSLIENSFDLITIFDPNGKVRYESPSVERLLGYSPHDLVGANAFNYIHPEDKNATLRAIRQLADQPGALTQVETRFRHKDGSWRFFLCSVRNMLHHPAVQGMVSNARDITDRKVAEQQLNEREQYLHHLMEQAADSLLVIDLDGNLVEVNASTCDSLQYPRAELLQMKLSDIALTRGAQDMRQLAEELTQQTFITFNDTHRRKDGVTFPVEVRLGLIHSHGKKLILGLARDITERLAVENALRESERFARSALDALVYHIAILDEYGVIVAVNRVWREHHINEPPLSARSVEDANYLRTCEAASAPFAKQFARGIRKVIAGERESFILEYSCGAGESQKWFIGRVTRFFSYGRARIVVSHEDVTEQRRAQEQIWSTNAILEATQEASADGIFLVDDRGVVVRHNQRFIELWKVPPEQVGELVEKQQLLSFVLSQLKYPDEFIERINDLYDDPFASSRDEIYLKDGRVFDRYSAPALSPQGTSYGRVWSFTDITERKDVERRLARQAFHDPLTGLPNRALFLDRVGRAMARARRHSGSLAILFLDLDRFKWINDSLGHEAGDHLLQAVAERLRGCLRPEDTAARLGGDEFVVLVEDICDVSDATRVAERIAQELHAPFLLKEQEVFAGTSIGITCMGTDVHEKPDDLLRDADAAMYRAKHRGGGHYQIFNKNMSAGAMEHLALETDLRYAIERDEFVLQYQPVIGLQNERAVGVETLLRWRHPERGMVSPGEFIPLAESTGLILPIGEWVLAQACQQAREWQLQFAGGTVPSVSINLSARQFQQPDLVQKIAGAIKEAELDPSNLVLEITESVVMEDAESTIVTLRELKDLGVQLAVDDFGTGYSSLSYLKRFPVDTLKIDRSFVNGLGTDSEDTAIVRAIITLAKSLGIDLTAEGVETIEQAKQLQELGCDRAQGYYFARPVAANEIETLFSALPKPATAG